jgi:Beta-glucosidase-related glycosidases
MIKKTCVLLALLSTCIYAITYPYVPTAMSLDTVFVPVNIITHTVNGSDNAYAGKVLYNYRIGPNDSLDVSLAFAPVGTGPAPVVTEVNGVSGNRFTRGFLENMAMNGENEIKFKCTITGTPAPQYTATITINATVTKVEKTVDSLIALMTNDEKAVQTAGNGSNRDQPNVDRLGIPGYFMSNGTQAPCVGSSGNATGMPGPSAMANTFDTALISGTGFCIAQEYWAKGKYMIEGPVVGLPIDPRCGRAAETFSEDPFLCGKMGAAYVRGAQSTLMGCIAKHYVCNEIETNRTTSNSVVSERTLREIFGYSFELVFREGHSLGTMSSYNLVNGVHATECPHTLTDLLKYDWGHRGYALSDMGAMHSTAPAANAGQDVELKNNTYFGTALAVAVAAKSVSQARLDDMASRILRAKVYAQLIGKIGSTTGITPQYTSLLMCQAHLDTCLKVGRESIVLAKNDNTLPLDKTKTVAVVGSYANQARQSLGGSGASSCALSSNDVSPLAGITAKVGASKVTSTWQNADAVIVVVGVSGEAEGSDRSSLAISSSSDNTLVSSIKAAGKPCITVITGGTAASQEAWYTDANAVIVAWYPGQKQGTALADIIYGDVNPSGKLSSSWPVNDASLPAFNANATTINYESPDTGHGYRWYDRTGKPVFLPFGYGLSYTTFSYNSISISPATPHVYDDIIVTANIGNTGSKSGDEVVQLYVSDISTVAGFPRPVKELRGFARVSLNAGEKKDVTFTLRPRELAYYNTTLGKFTIHSGQYKIMVAPSSKDLPAATTQTITLAP